MVDLGSGQKPIIMPHYPHMLAEDTHVWTKFLKLKSGTIKEVWYDVRVGQSVFLPAGASDSERRIAAGLTRKRIDVICSVQDGLWVVEVKPYANMYALGQILTYVRLFVAEYIAPGPVAPVIICDDYDLDCWEEFEEFGVLVLKNA